MSGAELLVKLKATGTGKDKLDVGRAVLRANPAATAADVVTAMEGSGVPDLTLAKARIIRDTGAYTLPPAELDIEDAMLAAGPAEKAAPGGGKK